jgi:hypothetical protein
MEMNGKFNRAEYNRQYYQKNKEKILERQAEKYQNSKRYKTLKKYLEKHLDEDLITIRDLLLSIEEDDPLEYEKTVTLMYIGKALLELKFTALGQPQEEIDKIRNLPVES